MKAASQLQRAQSLLPGQSTLPSSTIISDNLLVMELSSSSPLMRLRKLQISSPSPLERRVSVSCGIILWVGDSLGIPVSTRRKCYATHYLFFPCLLSLQFQGECENISNEFQIYFETNVLLLETLLDRNKLTVHFLVKTNLRSKFVLTRKWAVNLFLSNKVPNSKTWFSK